MTNKIFDFDGRTGQLIDQVNSSDLINNNVRIHNGEKGLCGKFNKVNTSLLSTCVLQGNSAFTITTNINISSKVGVQTIFNSGGWTDTRKGLVFLTNSSICQIFIGDGVSAAAGNTGAFFETGWHQFILTWDGLANSDINIYYDNQLKATLNINKSWVGDSDPIELGKYTSTGHLGGYISKSIVHGKVLSSLDRAELYKNFLHSFPLAETKRNFDYEYTSVPINEQVSYRNTFKYEKADGITIEPPVDTMKGTGDFVTKTQERVDTSDVIVNGTFDTDTDWIKGSAWTISGGVALTTGGGSFPGLSQNTPITVGDRFLLSFDVNYTSGTKVILTLGSGGNQPIISVLSSGRYSYEGTWGGITSVLYFRETSDLVGSIDNVSMTRVQQLPEKTNYRECTSNGVEAWQSKQAYGTWEFSIYHVARKEIHFVNVNKNPFPLNIGYFFYINSSNSIQFYRSSTSLFTTSINYIPVNNWYRFKITRATDGGFTVYIKGGSFGDLYTLVDVTGGTGTNPILDNTYTTSKYSVLDFDVGDRITNILTKKGIGV